MALLRGFKFAVLPARLIRLPGIGAKRDHVGMVAPCAFKGTILVPVWAGHDPSQHHQSLAPWAGRPVKWEAARPRRMGLGIRHAMHPVAGRERNTLGHRWKPRGRGAVIIHHGALRSSLAAQYCSQAKRK